ncbi:RYamide receptor-like [Gigantopelta aegis]|uniref:RYamide receptor-like n=1 Tax=Gigantopelta aegis TaxID=1735272 RepID=UPI001B88DCFE|nr:RYamide receptor-like [Gigantopelta aegis]
MVNSDVIKEGNQGITMTTHLPVNFSWDVDNTTSVELPPGHSPLMVPVYLQVTIITMYTLIVVLAFGGNTIVCFTVLRVRRMRTVINLFIVSLAISDILMALFCIPFTFVANLVLNYWPFGDFLCPVVTYLQVVMVFLSSFTLTAISLDRYVAIIFPLRQKLTKGPALIIIAIIWILSFVIPIPTGRYSSTHKYVNVSTAPTFCEEIWPLDSARKIYSTAILILQYIMPLAIMIVAYGQIIVVIWMNKTPGEAVSSRDQRMNESKKKITKMMLMVVIIYAVCWLPIHVINITGDVDPSIYDGEHMNIVWMISHWLAMSNCMYNPIVYCWMNSKFRQGFIQAFSCLLCRFKKLNQADETMRMNRQSTYLTSASTHSYRRHYQLHDSTEGSPLTQRGNGHIELSKA